MRDIIGGKNAVKVNATSLTRARDGVNGKGRIAIQSNPTNGRWLRTAPFAATIPAASRPYSSSFFRQSANNGMSFSGVNAAVTAYASAALGVIGGKWRCWFFPLGAADSVANADTTLPHTLEGYLDSAGATVLTLDGTTLATAGAAGVTAQPLEMIQVGGDQGQSFTTNMYTHLICSSVPNANARQVWRAWVRWYYGATGT